MSNHKDESRKQFDSRLDQMKDWVRADTKAINNALDAAHAANAKMEQYVDQRVNALEGAHSKYEATTKGDNREKRQEALLDMKLLLKTTDKDALKVEAQSQVIKSNFLLASSIAKRIASVFTHIKELFNSYKNKPETTDVLELERFELKIFEIEPQEKKFDEDFSISSFNASVEKFKPLIQNVDKRADEMKNASAEIAKAVQVEESSATFVKGLEEFNKHKFPERALPEANNNKTPDKNMRDKQQSIAQAAEDTRADALQQKNTVLPFLKDHFNALSTQGLAQSTVGNKLQAIIKIIDPNFSPKAPPVERTSSPSGVDELHDSPKATDAPLKNFQTNLSTFIENNKQAMSSTITTKLDKLSKDVTISIRKQDQYEAKNQLADQRRADDSHEHSSERGTHNR